MPRSYWWVNQGVTYQTEFEGGYVWAPLQDKRGIALKHWLNVQRLEPGDLILHHVRPNTKAIGLVVGRPSLSMYPAGQGPGYFQFEGTMCEVQYFELVEPIRATEIPDVFKEEERGRTPIGSPFNVNLKLNQGYLWEVSGEFFTALRSEFEDRWSKDLPVTIEAEDSSQAQRQTANELYEFLTQTMRLSEVYQPAIVKELLLHGGERTKEQLSLKLFEYDRLNRDLDDYRKILMRYPKSTLEKHGVVRYEHEGERFILNCDSVSEEETQRLVDICDLKIAEWLQSAGAVGQIAQLKNEEDGVPDEGEVEGKQVLSKEELHAEFLSALRGGRMVCRRQLPQLPESGHLRWSWTESLPRSFAYTSTMRRNPSSTTSAMKPKYN